jgi:Fe-S oxidoreductase
VLAGRPEELINDPQLWACLTCGMCANVCPSGVDYPAFVIAARKEARRVSVEGTYAHNAIMQQLMTIMAQPVQQKRTGWVTDDLQVSRKGKDLYFVGCAPYFDIIFADLGIVSTDAARDTVRLLNCIGIKPVVSDEERCCGADLLLNGDEEGFRRLAELNVRVIADSGAERVILACPECYHAFRSDYERVVGKLPFDVVHLTELLAEHLDQIELAEVTDEVVTYHDPCRLGRHSGIYEEPRALIQAIPGIELVEMRRNRAGSLCCGSAGWVNCGRCAKGIQLERLRQARVAGAGRMVTACPKCRIHLSCAVHDTGDDEAVALEDLATLLARALEGAGDE